MSATAHATLWGRKVDDHPGFEALVRAGFVAYGIVHLLVAWIALQLALGEKGGSADATGALSGLAGSTPGQLLLWAMAVGFAALVVWRLLEALLGYRDEDGAQRWLRPAYCVLKAAIYGWLAYSAAKVAAGGGTDRGRSGTDTLTAQLMTMPAGPVLVGAVGVALLGYAGFLGWVGVTAAYRDKLTAEGWSGSSGSAYDVLARVGYLAKGVALAAVAALFGWAAATHDANKSGGLDEALKRILAEPYGPVLLLAIAVGLACYGLFSLVRARHHDD